MQRAVLYLLTVIVVGFLLLYMVTYTIRFNEAGVITTFGRADSATSTTAGLGFKWPYPIQSATTYDTRLRQSQVKLETQQTRDARQIIVEGYCFWRVSDPLVFFRRFSTAGMRAADHFRVADETVTSNLRSAMGAVSKFEMSELFNSAAGSDGLGVLEQEIKKTLLAGVSGGTGDADKPAAAAKDAGTTLASVGIEIVDVGISQVVLPQDTTTKVMDRMGNSRDRLAKKISDKAQAEATATRAKAESDAAKILAFAKAVAADIRKTGDIEATTFMKMMKDDTGAGTRLAVFLREIEMIRDSMGRKGTTLVVPWSMAGYRLLQPNAISDILDGKGKLRTPEEMAAAQGKENPR